jgi:hypothetical protein
MMKYLSMFPSIVAAMKNNTCVQFDFRRSLLRKEASKYPWLFIHIHDSMMKGRSQNLQGMESIENLHGPKS